MPTFWRRSMAAGQLWVMAAAARRSPVMPGPDIENRETRDDEPTSNAHRRRGSDGDRGSRPGTDHGLARGGCDGDCSYPDHAAPHHRTRLQPGGHAERMDPAVSHEWQRQGIPPRGRTGGT